MLHIHRIILFVVGGLAILIAALDFLGVQLVVQHFSSRLAELTLIAIGFVALHVAIQDSKLSRIMRSSAETPAIVVRALQGAHFNEFPDAPAYWSYLTRQIEAAHSSIDDLTWGRIPSAQITAGAKKVYADYRKTIDAIAHGKGRHSQLVYREIMSFPDGYRIGRAQALLDANLENYHLRFYDFSHGGTPRLLQFTLIDQAELLIGVHGETGLAGKFISITSTGLVEAMTTYFEICWREAIPLKDRNHVDTSTWTALKNRVAEIRT
jgi:hypothetical protein